MSPTHDYQHGRLPEALARWADQLAGGRSWGEVEAEIVDCCEGRVDLLTQLLIRAETATSGSTNAVGVCCGRRRGAGPLAGRGLGRCLRAGM